MNLPRGYTCELGITKNGKRGQRKLEAISIVFSPRTRWPLLKDKSRVLEFNITQANLEITIEHGDLIPGSGDDFAPMSRQSETETTKESTSSSGVKATMKGGLESGEIAKNSTKHKRVNFTVTPRPEEKQRPIWNFYHQGAALEGNLDGRLTDIRVSDVQQLKVMWNMKITIHDLYIAKIPIAESANIVMQKLVRHKFRKEALEVHQLSAKKAVAKYLEGIRPEEVSRNDK